MKYIFLVLICLLLLSGCSLFCQEKNESCCILGRGCATAECMCIEGTVPRFTGCDNSCTPHCECVPAE